MLFAYSFAHFNTYTTPQLGYWQRENIGVYLGRCQQSKKEGSFDRTGQKD
jgi:hypothetical protein